MRDIAPERTGRSRRGRAALVGITAAALGLGGTGLSSAGASSSATVAPEQWTSDAPSDNDRSCVGMRTVTGIQPTSSAPDPIAPGNASRKASRFGAALFKLRRNSHCSAKFSTIALERESTSMRRACASSTAGSCSFF